MVQLGFLSLRHSSLGSLVSQWKPSGIRFSGRLVRAEKQARNTANQAREQSLSLHTVPIANTMS